MSHASPNILITNIPYREGADSLAREAASLLLEEIYPDSKGIPEVASEIDTAMQSGHTVVAVNSRGELLAAGIAVPRDESTSEITEVAVREPYRGQRIGQKIIKKLEGLAAEEGKRRMTVGYAKPSLEPTLKRSEYKIQSGSYTKNLQK